MLADYPVGDFGQLVCDFCRAEDTTFRAICSLLPVFFCQEVFNLVVCLDVLFKLRDQFLLKFLEISLANRDSATTGCTPSGIAFS